MPLPPHLAAGLPPSSSAAGQLLGLPGGSGLPGLPGLPHLGGIKDDKGRLRRRVEHITYQTLLNIALIVTVCRCGRQACHITSDVYVDWKKSVAFLDFNCFLLFMFQAQSTTDT